MNICFISYRENNPFIGGIEKVTNILSNELVARGHNVTHVSLINTNSYKKYTPACEEFFLPDKNDIQTETNKTFLSQIITEKRIQILINQYSTTQDFNTLCHNIKKQYQHIKVITPLHLDPLYRLKGESSNFFIKQKNGNSPRHWFLDCFLYVKFHIFKKWIIIKGIRKELEYIERISDRVLLLSEHVKKDITYIKGNNDLSKYSSVNNPIEKVDSCYCSKKKKILYVGRIEFGLKRFDRALNIWSKIEKKFPEWQFVVLGDGGYRQLFEQIAIKRGLKRIKFEGFQDPIPYYKESEIICLTSSSEGFANVLVEAQNYGCIPIAFDSYSALKDIIFDGHNGYVIQPFKNTKFANKIQELIKNPNARREMQNNAKKHSEKFDIRFIADQWEELFKELIVKE